MKLEQLTGLNPDFPVTEDSRILEAADYIHRARNLESLTVQEIARAVCLSESRLSHLFKQEAGISLHLYLANMKLERAFYLIPTGKPLTDICMEAGFSSPSHMSDISRKLYGLSMTQVKNCSSAGMRLWSCFDKSADKQKQTAFCSGIIPIKQQKRRIPYEPTLCFTGNLADSPSPSV